MREAAVPLAGAPATTRCGLMGEKLAGTPYAKYFLGGEA
jgi:hypothetical protein